jgi:hypothetical protein
MIQDRKANVIDAIVEAAATGNLSAEQLLQRLLEELPSDRVMEFAAEVGITEKDIVKAEAAELAARGVTVRRPTRPARWARQPEFEDILLSRSAPSDFTGLPYYDEKGKEYPSYEELVCRD